MDSQWFLVFADGHACSIFEKVAISALEQRWGREIPCPIIADLPLDTSTALIVGLEKSTDAILRSTIGPSLSRAISVTYWRDVKWPANTQNSIHPRYNFNRFRGIYYNQNFSQGDLEENLITKTTELRYHGLVPFSVLVFFGLLETVKYSDQSQMQIRRP